MLFDDWHASVDVVLVWVLAIDEVWVDERLADLFALLRPLGEVAGVDFGGANRVLRSQRGGLSGIPVPVGIVEWLQK